MPRPAMAPRPRPGFALEALIGQPVIRPRAGVLWTLVAAALWLSASRSGAAAWKADGAADRPGGIHGRALIPSTPAPLTPAPVPFADVSGVLGANGRHSALGWRDGSDNGYRYLITGQAWGDYNRDGRPDLYLTNQHGKNTLFVNVGEGRLAVSPYHDDVALGQDASGGAIFADYDNDGWPDLLVLGYAGDHLFHNQGGYGFRDVTRGSGITAGGAGMTASWADYDGDSRLDLFIANYGCTQCDPTVAKRGDRDRLYHNDGSGHFTDATRALPRRVTGGFTFVGGWLDYDDDGDPDLYVVNDVRGTRSLPGNALLRNDGQGCGSWCFTDVSAATGAGVRADGMGLAVGDFNGDQRLDLFVTNTGWARTPLTGPSMLLRASAGRFVESAGPARVDVDATSWGAVFLDYDNDGNRDLFVAVGLDPQDLGGQANLDRLLKGMGDATFRDVSATSGASYEDNTLGVAAADYNGDGWVDLVTGNIDDGYSLFVNRASAGAGNNRLTVRLQGGGPVNRDAVGSRVSVTTSDGRVQMQEIMAGTGLGGGSDLALSFGIGKAGIGRVGVRWRNGREQSFDHVAVNSRFELTYGAAPVVTPLARPRIPVVNAGAAAARPGRLARTGAVAAALIGVLSGSLLWRSHRRRRRAPQTRAAAGGVESWGVSIRGVRYPVVLPALRDPRLHLASVIISLQVLGQTRFGFELSIAQILVSLITCATLEIAIAMHRERVIRWPASALLTGNGVAFILRVPGTHHGDWWSLRGAWIFAATAAVSLLSKYAIRTRRGHVFNPSNLGLVLCFVLLGRRHAAPLDFWWGPMSRWMALALAIIVLGGLMIAFRLHLLCIAAAFWLTFASGIGLLAVRGHSMVARWHLGPITGAGFWWVLVTSPEILVFLFFMITDPRTVPAERRERIAFGAGVGLLASVLVAPQTTEFATKVAVLSSLAIVCAARPLLVRLIAAERHPRRSFVLAASMVPLGVVGLFVLDGFQSGHSAAVAASIRMNHGAGFPQVVAPPSRRVASVISPSAARLIAGDVIRDLAAEAEALRTRDAARAADSSVGERLAVIRHEIRRAVGRGIAVPAYRIERMSIVAERSAGQGPPIVVATLEGTVKFATYGGSTTPPRQAGRARFVRSLELALSDGRYVIARVRDQS